MRSILCMQYTKFMLELHWQIVYLINQCTILQINENLVCTDLETCTRRTLCRLFMNTFHADSAWIDLQRFVIAACWSKWDPLYTSNLWIWHLQCYIYSIKHFFFGNIWHTVLCTHPCVSKYTTCMWYILVLNSECSADYYRFSLSCHWAWVI